MFPNQKSFLNYIEGKKKIYEGLSLLLDVYIATENAEIKSLVDNIHKIINTHDCMEINKIMEVHNG